jgi:hypothetical protein
VRRGTAHNVYTFYLQNLSYHDIVRKSIVTHNKKFSTVPKLTVTRTKTHSKKARNHAGLRAFRAFFSPGQIIKNNQKYLSPNAREKNEGEKQRSTAKFDTF